jgi:CRP/FNR family transcriptional regulator, cyclic AMP receptor protein
MTHKHPRLAVDLIKGLAAVLAVRMREALLVGQFT